MKKMLGIFALLTLGVISVGSVYAFGGRFFEDEAVSQAIESADYDAFVSALESIDERFADRVTQEMFERMSDDYATMQAVNEALENHDYEAWVQAVSGMPNSEELLEKITEENFETFAELHQAQLRVRELSQELGLGNMDFGRGIKHGGMGRCMWG